jgi:hypothetical protein
MRRFELNSVLPWPGPSRLTSYPALPNHETDSEWFRIAKSDADEKGM